MKLKMLSAYHPETDGSSERSNKTVAQSLRYHVDRHQKGWVRALPLVRFNIMNTVNASTGFSPFQLRMGCSPHLIPPLTDSRATKVLQVYPDAGAATEFIEKLALDTMEAKDNLLAAKVAQAEFANRHQGPELKIKEGNQVMLSTEHRRREYMQSKSGCVTKLMPRFDGLFHTTCVHPETSNYMLDLPNEPKRFPTFHSSQLCTFVPNNNKLFPSCQLTKPGPVVTPDGKEEWLTDSIIDQRSQGHGHQYLVRWVGWGPEEDRWLPGREVAETEALDTWLKQKGSLIS